MNMVNFRNCLNGWMPNQYLPWPNGFHEESLVLLGTSLHLKGFLHIHTKRLLTEDMLPIVEKHLDDVDVSVVERSNVDHLHVRILGHGFITFIRLWDVKLPSKLLGAFQASGSACNHLKYVWQCHRLYECQRHYLYLMGLWILQGPESIGEVKGDQATTCDTPTSCHFFGVVSSKISWKLAVLNRFAMSFYNPTCVNMTLTSVKH